MKIKAILLMGGSGRRFGSGIPKQFHRLSGKKVYLYTLERLKEIHLFQEILLVCPESWIDEVEREVGDYSRVRVVKGGLTRQESSYLGLLACGADTDYVVIHDAVRPFVSREILQQNIDQVIRWNAVDTCIPSADTIVRSERGNEIDEIPKRTEYWRGQTPQSFAYPLILSAHRETQETNCSDDCTLVKKRGHAVHLVPGDEHNIKITTELDLFLAEQLLRLQQKPLGKIAQTLEGKRFVITGGTGGIGQALCDRLLEEGAIPLAISRNCSPYGCDLTSAAETRAVFAQIHQTHGRIDGLINCVGLFTVKEVKNLSEEEIEEQIAVNLKGPIFSCKWAEIKEGGHIVNVASSSYSRGRKNYAVYSCAKAALVNFTQALAEECVQLQVNAVVPERTDTLMRRRQFPEENSAELLTPHQVAKTIAHLLKQENTTGHIVEVRVDSCHPS